MKQNIQKINKNITFTIASPAIKYLRIDLTEEVKDLYNENYNTLMKEIEDKNNEDIAMYMDQKNNIIKLFILPCHL